jgi:hypothetical protein
VAGFHYDHLLLMVGFYFDHFPNVTI